MSVNIPTDAESMISTTLGEAPVATPEPSAAESQAPASKQFIWGTGRRKTAVARVRLRPGTGKFEINGKPSTEYFRLDKDRARIEQPLKATEMLSKVDVYVNAHGGGITGQADAIVLGVARALLKWSNDHIPVLRDNRFLRRDSREVERKKYGRSGARKRFQFSKR